MVRGCESVSEEKIVIPLWQTNTPNRYTWSCVVWYMRCNGFNWNWICKLLSNFGLSALPAAVAIVTGRFFLLFLLFEFIWHLWVYLWIYFHCIASASAFVSVSINRTWKIDTCARAKYPSQQIVFEWNVSNLNCVLSFQFAVCLGFWFGTFQFCVFVWIRVNAFNRIFATENEVLIRIFSRFPLLSSHQHSQQ